MKYVPKCRKSMIVVQGTVLLLRGKKVQAVATIKPPRDRARDSLHPNSTAHSKA
jgi:hypothetical protein